MIYDKFSTQQYFFPIRDSFSLFFRIFVPEIKTSREDMMKLFFELMQVAVGQLDCVERGPSPEEWQELYTLAQQQSVAAICYRSVVALFEYGLRAPQDLSLDWMAEAEDLKEQNRGTAKRLVALQQELEGHGVRSSFLTGAVLARFYDKDLQTLRQSNGSDLYVRGDVHQVNLKEWSDMDVRLCDSVKVGKSSQRSRKLERWLLQNDDQLFRKAGELTVPSYAVVVILQMVYLYNQYISGRLIMRDLMDLFFLLRWSEDSSKKFNFPRTTVEEVLTSLRLSRFSGGVMWMMQTVFALDGKNLPLAPMEHEGQFLMGELMGENQRIRRWGYLLMHYRWCDLI